MRYVERWGWDAVRFGKRLLSSFRVILGPEFMWVIFYFPEAGYSDSLGMNGNITLSCDSEAFL